MKRLNNLLIIAVTITVALSACYEEGSKISFRTKRDRLANEWVCTDYTIDGSASDSSKKSFYIGDSITFVFSIMRNNKYALNMAYTKEYSEKNNNKLLNLKTNMNSAHFIDLVGNLSKNNLLFQKIDFGGEWSFADKFRKVDFGHLGNRDLSYADEKQIFTADVVMLKNKNLKLSFKHNDKEHMITFEPLNPEIVKN
ncbi:MAG TPA: hypothetical protein VGF79_03520 [Bacteroidia bacterium]